MSFPAALLETGIWAFLPIDSVLLSEVGPNKAFTVHKAYFLLGGKMLTSVNKFISDKLALRELDHVL